ncbi:hypothetical protein C8R44DRAFT_752684 [Mycena epipterygia]|nr:hypothetical protein C8R44DRAFT_752684 [Mycena epipterygia]
MMMRIPGVFAHSPNLLATSLSRWSILRDQTASSAVRHFTFARQSRSGPRADSIPGEVLVLQERLPELFHRTVNLESLDYCSYPGIDMKTNFAVDYSLRNRNIDIPVSPGPSAAPGGLNAQYDAEIWEIEPLLLAAGPSIASLELQHVNGTVFTILTNLNEVSASYGALEHLKIDITEGVWDWGGGSLPKGALSNFLFPHLGFPSVKRLELVVCDATLHHTKTGLLDLIHSKLLTELSLDARHIFGWCSVEAISLFEALSPLDLLALACLEIKDNDTRNTAKHYWDCDDDHFSLEDKPRTSWACSSLSSFDPHWLVANVIWSETLRAAFGQLESLRVGFGAITHLSASLILGLCSTKLTQFGFEWNWRHYEVDDPIPLHFLNASQFPKLTDVHILFPRPETQFSGLPDSVVNARTLSDASGALSFWSAIPQQGPPNSEGYPIDLPNWLAHRAEFEFGWVDLGDLRVD